VPLGHKLVLFALALLALLSAQWGASIARERSLLMEEAQERAAVLVRNMAELAREPIASGRLGSLDRQIRSFLGERDVTYARILDHRSRVLAASEDRLVGWSISGPPEPEGFLRWTDVGLVARAPIRIPGQGDGYVELGMDRGPLDAKIRRSLGILARFLAAELALFLAFMILLYRQLFEPVRALVARLGQARPEAGYEPIDLPRRAAPEIARIARAVDELRMRAAEYQAELVAEERLATIGRMAADLAHEIRNPLEAISGAVEALAGAVPQDNEFTRVIREEVRNLNEYLAGILEFARKGGRRPEAADLADLIREAAALAAPRAREARVLFDLRLSYCPCVVSRSAVKRAVLNLLLNAVEASAPGQAVEAATERFENSVVLRVRDRGSGVAPSDRMRLFEPYFTTKPGGTGLGLALARQTVEEHGGTLTLESADGDGGTQAILRLPAREERE